MRFEGRPKGAKNSQEESQKSHETAFNFLTNIPIELEKNDGNLKMWAARYNEIISIAVSPKEEADKNFYVYYDGKKTKMSKNFRSGSMAYLVYHPNGSVMVSEYSVGIEAHSATRPKKIKNKKEI